MLYRSRSKLKGVEERLDHEPQTEPWQDVLNKANDQIKKIQTIKFCHFDINCTLKVNFTNKDQ